MAEAAHLLFKDNTPSCSSVKTKWIASCVVTSVIGALLATTLFSPGDTASTVKKESFDDDLRLRCNETYFTQTLDHFTGHIGSYQQRYFICSQYWHVGIGPIFFYTGKSIAKITTPQQLTKKRKKKCNKIIMMMLTTTSKTTKNSQLKRHIFILRIIDVAIIKTSGGRLDEKVEKRKYPSIKIDSIFDTAG
jgi:hypothetical protein